MPEYESAVSTQTVDSRLPGVLHSHRLDGLDDGSDISLDLYFGIASGQSRNGEEEQWEGEKDDNWDLRLQDNDWDVDY